jgi:hypothetical protein
MVKKKKEEAVVQVVAEPEAEEGLVRVKFELLEERWRWSNFEQVLGVRDPMAYIDDKLVEVHGRIKQVRLFLDFEQQHQLAYKFSDLVGQVFRTEGARPPQDITVYYDFKLGFRCPLLLY